MVKERHGERCCPDCFVGWSLVQSGLCRNRICLGELLSLRKCPKTRKETFSRWEFKTRSEARPKTNRGEAHGKRRCSFWLDHPFVLCVCVCVCVGCFCMQQATFACSSGSKSSARDVPLAYGKRHFCRAIRRMNAADIRSRRFSCRRKIASSCLLNGRCCCFTCFLLAS